MWRLPRLLSRLKPAYLGVYLLVGSTLLFLALTDKIEWDIQTQDVDPDADELAVSFFGNENLSQRPEGEATSGRKVALWLEKLRAQKALQLKGESSLLPSKSGSTGSPSEASASGAGQGSSNQEAKVKAEGSALYLGLSSQNIRAINRGSFDEGYSASTGSGDPQRALKQLHSKNVAKATSLSSATNGVLSAGKPRRPKWIEDLQRQDRQALISKLGKDSAKSVGIDETEPNEETHRLAMENLLKRVRAREVEATREIRRWRALGHPWPPFKAKVPPPLSASSRATVFPRDLGVIVLYVHNRVHYLQIALEALSRVEGIKDMLLIVSHDGYYEAMDEAVKRISFCHVKQLYFPYSVHAYTREFPATSPEDCTGTAAADASKGTCFGQPDSFGHYRNATFVSLKHHWWWLMNTVWDSLEETRGYQGHILFMEEDHYLFPNALLQLRALIQAKQEQPRFASCVSVHAAPADVASKGEAGLQIFVREKMGNMGYAFNRSIWTDIRRDHKAFCYFDDYNWDVSLSAGILRFWPDSESLRWSRTSAVHFGNCGGLHMMGIHRLGPANDTAGSTTRKELLSVPSAGTCIEPSKRVLEHQVLKHDVLLTVDSSAQDWTLGFHRVGDNFFGWGGWGDSRDQELCKFFALGHSDKG